MTNLRLDMYVNFSEYLIAEGATNEYNSVVNAVSLPAQFEARIIAEIKATGGAALTADEIAQLNAAYAEYTAWRENDDAGDDDIADDVYALARWAYEQFEAQAERGIHEITWCMCLWDGNTHLQSLVAEIA